MLDGARQVVRGWFGRRTVRRRREERVRRRREAMEAVWYVTVLGAMEKSIARFEKVTKPNQLHFRAKYPPAWQLQGREYVNAVGMWTGQPDFFWYCLFVR